MESTVAFIRCFVEKDRQERYLALASKPKRRHDFIWDLAHDGRHLERGYMHRLRKEEATLVSVAALLRSLGAGDTCHVIAAAHLETDDREMSTAAALAAVVGKSGDSLLFFPSASLGYYENHEGEQFILRAKAIRR
jgi:hypothetical protein